jgi:hypothetical protein
VSNKKQYKYTYADSSGYEVFFIVSDTVIFLGIVKFVDLTVFFGNTFQKFLT